MSAATFESSAAAEQIAGPGLRRPRRIESLDRVRGLAIVLMVGDHVARLIPDGWVYRDTLGRVAMPLFFVLAGTLARRVTRRTVGVGLLGMVWPFVVPWLDAPNVLTWWALGVGLVAAVRTDRAARLFVLAAGLAMYANGWTFTDGLDTYAPLALLGLMTLGSFLRFGDWGWGDRLPRWLAWLGRRPVWWYLGHTLALELVIVVWRLR